MLLGGAGNSIYAHRDLVERLSLSVHFQGSGNELWLDAGSKLRGQISFLGSNGTARFSRSRTLNVAAAVYDDGTLLWGPDCTAYGVRVWVHGGRTCTIGTGCLFSENIQIRTSDHHSIIDLETGVAINDPTDVTIGDRVWISEGARINKGVTIGSGSIIAGSAFVSSSVPPAQLWGGVPARLLRENVSWVDELPASAQAVDALLAWTSDYLSR